LQGESLKRLRASWRRKKKKGREDEDELCLC
jgi:hypothetical protein